MIRSTLTTKEPALARQFMDASYGTRMRLSGRLEGEDLHFSRVGTDQFTVDHVVLPGTLHFACDPLSRLVVSVARQGNLGVDFPGRSDRPAPATPLLTPCGQPYRVVCEATVTHAITIDTALLHDTLGTLPEDRIQLHFLELQAPDPAAARLWNAAASFASRRLDGVHSVPALLSGQMAHLLATTLLAVFPHQTPDHRRIDSTDATPATLQRALAYIDAHAHLNITLADIARAAYASPRALQQAFRRHRDTTPLAYLRRARLEQAHRELQAATPDTSTVTQIAARWGFAHTSRFAGHYRDAFGQPPAMTLRQNTRHE
ncbi:helix-turn-helix transcriptional regulator [Streptomyces sp. NPDC051214]|uniref:helix-turn-helix transcriptional regulator n=1 Tax=Streptomyces sp. NPDC051214 TaxID=3155282 RepID=UPI003438DC9D